YYKSAMLLKIITVSACVFALFMLLHGTGEALLATFVAYLIAGIYILYRVRKRRQIRNVLINECNPQKMLSMYITLMSYGRRNTGWESHLYNIGSALFYAGRFDDVKKILELFPKYCDTNKGKVFYEILCMRLAYQEGNAEQLNVHDASLRELMQITRLSDTIRLLCQEVTQYPLILDLENKEEYRKIYEMYLNIYGGKGILSQIKQNYMLCRMAEKLGMEKEDQQYRAFVTEHGGGLFYASALSHVLD
ncbi:MAG: hypothetical protein K2N82_09055, partial [Lachnospiraceae bacterium]|nr:hypothetical protein [Lachnospiraceae bacterium]